MSQSPQPSTNPREQIARDIAGFYDDPYGFVMYAFPWGVPGTQLADEPGPDVWQAAQLRRIGEKIRENPLASIQEAIASGHGIGKSAEVAWIILWMMSTRPHLAGWVTANTQPQLKSKTWRELAVWHKRAINEDWFKWTATRFFHADHPETWGIDAIPWTEHNSESFAGLHAEHVLMIMDEASAIADVIWEVAEGAMTTPRAMWLCFGNPTRNTGRFRECFGRRRARWETQQIDSRTCRMVKNREKIRQWEEDYGDDSDFFRIRVRGEFPRASSTQLIPSDVVAAARKYKAEVDDYAYMPIAIGVDVARFGGDESVIAVRQGPKILVLNCYRELDNMQVASRVIEQIRAFQGATTFVDSVGVGSGVADRLKSLGYPVVEVNAGAKAEDPSLYYNKGAETWTRMRDWLMAGADIPDDPTLAAQLEGREYGYTPKEQIRLERKEDMKDRGMESPDRADAIANTFAEHVHVEHYANNGPGVVRRGSYEPDFEV